MGATDVVVQIVGMQVACLGEIKDPWRGVAAWTAGQLRSRFGDAVRVEYFDLFDPACPLLLPDAQLPVVLVGGTMLSSGGKISIPAIRQRLELLQTGGASKLEGVSESVERLLTPQVGRKE